MNEQEQTSYESAIAYAMEMWGNAEFDDDRLWKRAVAALSIVTHHPLGSFVEACQGNKAKQEQLYRFVRDGKSDCNALVEAGCAATCRLAERECSDDIAVIQDTTSYGFRHAVREQLGDLGSGRSDGARRGFFSHVSMAVDEARGTVIGPVDLQFAVRPVRTGESKRNNKEIAYEDKESFKWEAAATAVDQRSAAFRDRLIFVSDRESDVYEYMMSLVGSSLRFVLRSSWNRLLEDRQTQLREHVAQSAPLCRVRVHIDQKGGRKARDVVLEVRAATVRFDGRKHSQEVLPPLDVNAVHLTEVDPPVGIDPVEWLLLTSEPIGSVEQVVRVVRLYCLRWLVEEYNKCCKSDGTDIEALRMQSKDALLRAAVLCMFAAVPLMRLRGDLLGSDTRRRWPELIDAPTEFPSVDRPPSPPCTSVLPTLYWTTLWSAIERTKPLPEQPPTRQWALMALAKLGGWMDSKRIGRPGYRTLWKGWDRLLERVDAVRLVTDAGVHPSSCSGEK